MEEKLREGPLNLLGRNYWLLDGCFRCDSGEGPDRFGGDGWKGVQLLKPATERDLRDLATQIQKRRLA